MPCETMLADCRDEAVINAYIPADKYPTVKVEVVRQRGFSHKKAMRWLFDEAAKTLKPVAFYDRTMGTGNLLAEPGEAVQ